MIEKVLDKPGFWELGGPNNDIVISSRIRLARNMYSISFPETLDEGEKELLKFSINKFLDESKYSESYLIDIQDLNSNEKRFLRERNIITSEMEPSSISAVIVNMKHEFVILINEEDHFRIQIIKPGLQLYDTYRIADSIDDELNKFINYAFSHDYGYLSACPSNLGTGIRASVLLHLPVLSLNKKISELKQSVNKKGLLLKSANNQTTPGNIYQLSNKVSLGLSEIDIIEILDEAINKIIDWEDMERDEYLTNHQLELEDRIYRSLGVLKYSRKLNFIESMEHLSNLRLGIVLAIIRNIDLNSINHIMVHIQWAHLQHHFGKDFANLNESDEYRADYIRSCLE